MSISKPTLRLRARALFAAVALCLCAACLCAPLAQASETVTRSVAGVNFTLPADWDEVAITEGVDEATGVSNVQAYTKGDGVFVAATMPDADLAGVELDELDLVASMATSYLADTPLSTIAFSAQEEQGVPALTASTDDLALNGVGYSLTFKLFVVNRADFAGGVLMLSVLPTSGEVSDRLDDLFTELAEPTRVTVAGISYEVPAGMMVFDGYAFGVDFGVALGEDGVLFLADIPELADDGTVTVDDLQLAADQILQSDEFSLTVDGTVQDMWSGAYSFLGFPTLGCECTVADDASGEVMYMAVTASVTPAGLGLVVIVQPEGSPFAEGILGSAEAMVEPLPAAGSSLPQVIDLEPADTTDPGFVVGVPNA